MRQPESKNYRQRKEPAPLLFNKGYLPPQAPEMEAAILGAIILERSKLEEVLELMPTDECFYVESNKKTYSAVLTLVDQGMPVDMLTVTEQLRKDGNLESVGGAYYLTRLTMNVVSSAHVESHTRIIIEKFILREMIRISHEVIAESYRDENDVFETLENMKSELDTITNRLIKRDFEHAGSDINDVLMDMEESRNATEDTTGLPTPFRSLTEVLNGWRPGVIIVAARPGTGKTSFGLLSALEIAESGTPTAFFSLEMPKRQLQNRLLASISRVEYKHILRPKLQSDEDRLKIAKAATHLRQIPLFLDNTPSLATLEFRAKVRRLIAKGAKLIVLDYIQLMTYSGKSIGNREQEVAAISREIKKLQIETGIPFIILCQTSRSIETRSNKKPMMSDLRESGAIESDADVVMIACKAEEVDNSDDPSMKNKVLLSVLKNREGEEAELFFYMNNNIQRWTEEEISHPSPVFDNPYSPALTNRRPTLPVPTIVDDPEDLPF